MSLARSTTSGPSSVTFAPTSADTAPMQATKNKPLMLGPDMQDIDQVPLSQGSEFYESTTECASRPSESVVYASFHETRDHWTLQVDLPGVDADNLSVSFDSSMLVIKAYRKDDKAECKACDKDSIDNLIIKESVLANIVRKISLPHNLILDKGVKSSFKNGVLHIQFDRIKHGKSVHLEI